ncbi:alanine racemase [Candidatus Dependentiae bacterium]|nr:alanine racemase [Candidatus Dependentiae bacterium]
MTSSKSLRTWLEIDAAAFTNNIKQLAKIIPNDIAVVLKSNAYGHGSLQIAKICENLEEVKWLCTAGNDEALLLRSNNIKKPIICVSYLKDNLEESILQNIDLVIYDLQTAEKISSAACKVLKHARIHIKIDTGMSRFGILPEDALEFVSKLQNLPYIKIVGLMSHLSDTDNIDQSFTNHQLKVFDEVIENLNSHSISFEQLHIAASGAFMHPNNKKYTITRIGGLSYALWKSDIHRQRVLNKFPELNLKPVMQWKSCISQIKEIPADSFVGYNKTFKTTKKTKIAILPVGYFDGVSRALSNSGVILIKDQFAPVLGIVSMNIIIVDVTGLDININDEAILLGNKAGIRPEDWAAKLNTITNEIVTRINPEIERKVTNSLEIQNHKKITHNFINT